MWRLIQYFRIRNFSRIDESLKPIFRMLVRVAVGAEDVKEGIMLADCNHDAVGYMPFKKEGDNHIGVTWVGNRSISEYKLANFRAEIKETLRKLDE